MAGLFSLAFFIGCDSSEFSSAKVYLQNQMFDEAEAAFMDAMEVEPDNELIPFLLAAEIYFPQRRYEEMVEMLDESERRMGNRNTRYQGELLANHIEALKENAWMQVYNRATQIYNAYTALALDDPDRDEQLELATQDFEFAQTLYPERPETYTALANAYSAGGNTDQAIEALTTALELDPENASVLGLLGQYALSEGNTDEAIDYLQRSFEADGTNTPILVRLVSALANDDQLDRASETLEAALTQLPRTASSYYNIAIAYSTIGSAYRVKGIELYVATNQGSRSNEDYQQALDYITSAQNAYSDALYNLDTALALDETLTAAESEITNINEIKRSMTEIQTALRDFLAQFNN